MRSFHPLAIWALLAPALVFGEVEIVKEAGWDQVQQLAASAADPIGGSDLQIAGLSVRVDHLEFGEEAEELQIEIPLMTPVGSRWRLNMLRLAVRELAVFSVSGRRYCYAVDAVQVLGSSDTVQGYGPRHRLRFFDENGDGSFTLLVEWPEMFSQPVPPGWLIRHNER